MIPEIRHLEYEDRKCITNVLPNIGILIEREDNMRNGTKFEVPISKEMSSKRRYSLPIRGPELFSLMPAHIRDLNILQETFKSRLDEYLALILDRPRIGVCLKSFHSNKLDDVIRQWRWSLDSNPRYHSTSSNVSGGTATNFVN